MRFPFLKLCCFLHIFLLASVCEAKWKSQWAHKSGGGIFFHLAGNYQYANSKADKVSGATYTSTFAHPLVGAAGIGTYLWSKIYIGARYEYWIGGREFSVGGSSQKDKLEYQSVGLELGYLNSNPLVLYFVALGAYYPVQLNVTNATSVFANPKTILTYQARAALGFRLASFFSLLLEGGYRYQNFCNMLAGSTPLLTGG